MRNEACLKQMPLILLRSAVLANRRWSWILVSLLAGVPQFANANTDVVYFHNGDRLTGDIKSLERGKLRFKTAATNTISC